MSQRSGTYHQRHGTAVPLLRGHDGHHCFIGPGTDIVRAIVHVATASTLPFWGLISSFFINFFVPGAGGHWVIQGPPMIEAAKTLGAPIGHTAMAVMLGNAWNNLVQPFWVLPTLAISKLNLRDIMGYTILSMIWIGVVYSAAILLWQ
jgi:short-chain fatty acids transporter